MAIEDANGNVTAWVVTNVTIAISNNPTGHGVLIGATNQTSLSGEATFNDLVITNDGGSGYTLAASIPNLPTVVSSPFNIVNPLPGITSLDPFYTPAGVNNVLLTVNGNNFVASSTIEWNGSPLFTSYVSSTELTANVPGSDVSTVGTVSVTVVSPAPGGGTSSAATFYIQPTLPPVVYVDTNYTSLAANTWVNWPYTGSGPHIVGYDAFGAIQAGVNAVTNGGTVNVAAGTYAENVTVSQSLSLLGPNANIDPNTETRIVEAVIVPGAVQTSAQGSTSGVLIRVGNASSHVDATIKGFTLNGHNGNLSGGVTLNGVEIDTGAGIVNSINSFDTNPGSFDTTIIVQNNILQNLERYGVLVDSVPASTPNAGNDVSHNKIDNLPAGNNFSTPGRGRGRGVAFEDNSYGTCTFNVMTRVNVGWQDDNFWQASPASGTLVASNTISTYHRGIYHNLQYQSATAATIQGNNIQVETGGDQPASSSNFGIELSSIQDTVSEAVIGNNVTNNIYGIMLWNVPSTGNVIVSGGTVSGNQIGVWATSQDPQFGPAAASQSIISNVTVVNATIAGVEVDDSTATAATKATITGNSVVSGNPLGLFVNGAAASAIVLNNSATITSNGIGIDVDTGAALIQNNDLTGNTVAGIVATNGAKVDAGNCTGTNVTGLGISTGGNNLSGYLNTTDGIINANPGGVPEVLADHDNFGTSSPANIPSAFRGAVEYSESPAVIVAPPNITVTCVAETEGAEEFAGATNLAEFTTQGGYYSASSATVSFSDSPHPSVGINGNITRTYTVTDGCTVASTCAQTITVDNTNAPSFTIVPLNMTLDTDAGECSKSNVIWTVTALGYCGDTASVVSTPASGSTFGVGPTVVTLVATDVSGNQATTNFTVTVIATNLPSISCPGAKTIVANATNAQATIPDLTSLVTASDPCVGYTLSQTPVGGTTVGLGQYPVTVWATDQYGNSNYCTATITVIYTNSPVLACAVDETVSVTQDKEPYAIGYPTATDPDGPVAITYSDDVSGLTNCDVTGDILRTWTAVDASSNVATCVQTITVVDTNAPYFAYLPGNITTTNDWNQCGAMVNYGAAALDLGYYQGFENTNWIFNTNSANDDLDWNGYYTWGPSYSTMYRVPSGSNGIVSPNGVAYGIIDSTATAAYGYASNGVYTAFGGGCIPFASGYKVVVDVYINFNDPEVLNSTPTSGYGYACGSVSKSNP